MPKKVPGAFISVDVTLGFILCMSVYDLVRGTIPLFKF